MWNAAIQWKWTNNLNCVNLHQIKSVTAPTNIFEHPVWTRPPAKWTHLSVELVFFSHFTFLALFLMNCFAFNRTMLITQYSQFTFYFGPGSDSNARSALDRNPSILLLKNDIFEFPRSNSLQGSACLLTRTVTCSIIPKTIFTIWIKICKWRWIFYQISNEFHNFHIIDILIIQCSPASPMGCHAPFSVQ